MSQLFRVLYDFDAEEEGEMTVSAGDIVKVIPQDDGPDGWNDPRNGWVFVQSTRTGKTGYVPIDYLEPAHTAVPPNKTKSSPSSSVNSAQKLMNDRPRYDSPEVPGQGARMSLSSLLDKAKSAEAEQRGNGSVGNGREKYAQTPGGYSTADTSFTSNTTPADKKIAADSLPFGLGESPAFGKQSMASLAGSSGKGGASSGSASKMGKSGKLLKAAKSVQNMVRVTNIVAAPRVPSLATAAEREDFEELIKRNDEYFARLLASQAETFDSLTDMVDALSSKLHDSAKCSNDLVLKLSELDELIDEEKRKWKQQNEAEKNADVLGRSKDLIRAGDKDAKNSQQALY